MYFVLFGLQASEAGKLQSSLVALDITTNTFLKIKVVCTCAWQENSTCYLLMIFAVTLFIKFKGFLHQ